MPAFGQSYQISGQVLEEISEEPIAFVHVIANGHDAHAFTNINGFFTITSKEPIAFLQFKHPIHPLVLAEVADSVPNIFYMRPFDQISFRYSTAPDAQALIDSVLAQRHLHAPTHWNDLAYQTYSKLTVGYGEVKEVKRLINKLLGKVSFTKGTSIDSVMANHHLFMMESITHKKYFSHLFNKETITASKVTGIDKPSVFTLTSQLQPLSVYEHKIFLTGKEFHSPLIPNAHRWYYFTVLDTALIDGETIYTVQFNPLNKRKIDFMKGWLYINASDYSVRYVDAVPNIGHNMEYEYEQSYMRDSSGLWVPEEIRTSLIKDRFSQKKNKLEVVAHTAFFNYEREKGLHHQQFDEIVLDYREPEEKQDRHFWKKHRQLPFFDKDSLTYLFFDSVGKIRNFEKLVRLGEGLYYGEIPFKNVDFEMHRMLDFNQYEGVRLGMGLHTNERLFDWASVGAYIGYGMKDAAFKYGVTGMVRLSKRPMLQIGASHIRDLREAGAAEFAFDAPQFKSEGLRRYRVLVKDLVSRSEIWLQAKPMRYLDLRVGIRQERSEPTYSYTFEGNAGPYQIAEWRVGIRYAFGERVMQSLHRTISFGTKYPVAWLQVARSVAGRWGSVFTYTKIDFKAQHSRHFLGFGKSALQVRMGKLWGTAPYSLLYNGLGSYRTWAAIARNSFETMGYNEFMSDWHFSAFYTHNFGQLHLRKLNKQPSFEMSHAIGFGGLRNPSSHGFPVKTMEKGYFESGFFMNNLVSVGALGLSLNVGAGVFARYGAYAFPDFSDNIVYKLAIEVSP